MKKTVLILAVSILMVAGSVFAAGDLDVTGNIRIDGNVIQTQTGRDAHFKGFLLENGESGGFVRKNGMKGPLISFPYVFIGDDGGSVSLAWDTGFDGQWGYCEGLYDNNAPGWMMNCADYSATMDSNDYYFVWKHGFPGDNAGWCTGDCRTKRRDYKFLYDGESNDGVMGYMEDEDAFFFDDAVGIGTRAPLSKLAVSGLPTSPPDSSGTSSIVCITPAGNMWVDDDGTNDCQ